MGHEDIICRTWRCDCLVPRRLSLDENVRAKEGRKETWPAICTLPMVPCSSSPVARLYLAKNEVPEAGAGDVKCGTQDFNMQDMEM